MDEGTEQKRYLKKRIRGATVELADDECAIVVRYEVEGTFLGDDGQTPVTERELKEKRIKLKKLNETSNISKLAQDVVEKCKVLHASKLPIVEEALRQLQRRELEADYRQENEEDMQDLHRRRLEAERYQEAQQPKYDDIDRASMDDLETYLEQLYEGTEEKVKAAYMISQLARHTECLEGLIMHKTLLGALARVLKEDGKKSLDLSLHIVAVFFALSNFSQFHQIILEQQIGNMTMGMIDLEIQRTEARVQAEGPGALAVVAPPGSTPTEQEAKQMLHNRKQEKLLYLSFYLLLNIAEDVNIEKKMKKRNIVSMLCKMLQRRSIELLMLVMMFLKKLSIYKENKDAMQEAQIIDKLALFVPCKNEALLACVLRLLTNLSFDNVLREDMVKAGLIPKLVDLLKTRRHLPLVLGLLYHLSIDDKCKSMFTYTDAIHIVLDMLLESPDTLATPELIALAVNLTANARNAEVLCEGDGLEVMLTRALRMRDSLLFKVVRNLSQQDDLKPRFQPFMRDMIRLLRAPDTSTDLVVELLGTLGNLTLPGLGLEQLAREFELLPFLAQHLQPGVVEDDLLLEVVILVGTLCAESTAQTIVQSQLVQKLCALLQEKRGDDEIVLQTVYTFHQFLLYEPTRQLLLRMSQLVPYLVELLQERNKEVVKMADKVLDMIQDLDPHWAAQIRQMKFEAHNQEWLHVIEEDSAEEEELAQRGSFRGSHGSLGVDPLAVGQSPSFTDDEFGPQSSGRAQWQRLEDGSPYTPSQDDEASPYWQQAHGFRQSQTLAGNYHDSHGYL